MEVGINWIWNQEDIHMQNQSKTAGRSEISRLCKIRPDYFSNLHNNVNGIFAYLSRLFLLLSVILTIIS